MEYKGEKTQFCNLVILALKAFDNWNDFAKQFLN